MNFLRGLLAKLIDWWQGSPAPAGFDPFCTVEAGEALARYFVSTSKVNQATKKLRAEAFVPHPHKEMSVFRIRECTHIEVRHLGQTEFGDKLTKPAPVLGWGRFKAGALDEDAIRLRLASWKKSDSFHARHRDVIGWPIIGDDAKATKAKQKEIALEISERTILVMSAVE